MLRLIGVGGPSLIYGSDASWDLAPLVLSLVALIVFRRVLKVRLRWYVVIAVLLLAPPTLAFAGRVGASTALALALIALFVTKRILAQRYGPPTV